MRPQARRGLAKGKGAPTPAFPPLARPKPRVPKGVRILTLDIETSPLLSYHWRIFDENIGIDQIQEDTTILSFGAKWLDSRQLIYLDTGGRGVDKVRDDSILMQPLWNLLHQADVIVMQNGQAFDRRTINARLAIHGYSPPSPYKVVDTHTHGRQAFRFTSNKLEWQARVLTHTTKHKHSKFPGFELWLECMKDNPKAWAEMKKYNLQDVRACEAVYLKQRPWINHPNVSAYDKSLLTQCRTCGSANIEADGYETTRAAQYVRYRCNDCGAWSRGKQMLTPAETRKVKVA